MSNVIQLSALRYTDIPTLPDTVTVVTRNCTGFQIGKYLGQGPRGGSGGTYYHAANRTEFAAGHRTYADINNLKADLAPR